MPYAFAVPLPPGRTDDWLRFMDEVDARLEEHQQSHRRIGGRGETVFLQRTPHGDMAVVVLESEDPAAFFEGVATSQAPYDVWFRSQLKEIHGIDFDNPAPLNEQKMHWRA
jgi:hypothetical protein